MARSPRILVVQPDDSDPPARLGEWLTGAGAELDVVRPATMALPAGLDGHQGLVCLGGDMFATDDAGHPWLADVRRLLSGAVTRQVPVLAICLGAQLLAVAMGGQVRAGESGLEVGPRLVAKRDLAWRDPLFADLPFMPDVLQFHSDVIATLPPDAELLASAPHYPNQAFRVGPSAYGVQFHIETSEEILRSWVTASPDEVSAARPGDFEPERIARLHRDLEETWRPFAERFVLLSSGDLEPAVPARPGLPLA